MSSKDKISDFLTADISYLLGLITGRGLIQYTDNVKRISIDFEYKSLEARAIETNFNQRWHIQTSLDPVVYRLQEIGINVQKIVGEDKISLLLTWIKEDIAWLFIKFIINGTRYNYHDFEIPNPIFDTTTDNKKEFLRGLSDVTGYVRSSNRDLVSKHRVYIEISNKNWFLPPQICKLLQSLNIPVQNINYGHPNLRGGTGMSWAKEHQIKIYADNFREIGFYISHKNEALNELADFNIANYNVQNILCNGVTNRIREKDQHADENHERLPSELRGQHFNSFREICRCLDCYLQRRDEDV